MKRQAVYDKVFDTPKTEKSRRAIPLSEPVTVCLHEWWQVSQRIEPTDFILSGRNGGPMDQARMLRRGSEVQILSRPDFLKTLAAIGLHPTNQFCQFGICEQFANNSRPTLCTALRSVSG